MKRSMLWILIPLVLTLLSCGQRKRNAVFYEQMVDSIRKAEQLKEMKRQAGVYDDPVEAFFDTLQLRPLPIQSERSDFAKIGRFGRIPLSVISQLGYPVELESTYVTKIPWSACTVASRTARLYYV